MNPIKILILCTALLFAVMCVREKKVNMAEQEFTKLRLAMVEQQILARGGKGRTGARSHA